MGVALLEVQEARYVSGFKVWLAFSDGTEGTVDLADALWGPVFESLRDVRAFGQVYLSPTLHTIAWPNDADLAPEFLKQKLVEQADLEARN